MFRRGLRKREREKYVLPIMELLNVALSMENFAPTAIDDQIVRLEEQEDL